MSFPQILKLMDVVASSGIEVSPFLSERTQTLPGRHKVTACVVQIETFLPGLNTLKYLLFHLYKYVVTTKISHFNSYLSITIRSILLNQMRLTLLNCSRIIITISCSFVPVLVSSYLVAIIALISSMVTGWSWSRNTILR